MKYIFLVFMLFLRFSGISQTIHYVKETSSGSGNGTSWANASGDLQAMINKATAGDTIWVAAGTYKPVRTAEGWSNGAPEATNNALPDGNRNNAFVMKSGVVILGGFRSNADDITDISLAQRNWATNVTILSGDIGIMGNSTDNAYHVVCAVNIINSVLDGFTITGGNANGDPVILISINGNIHRINRGGGIYTYGVTDTKFINLIVRNNDADMHGGGMVNRSNSAPVVINSVFCNNNTTSTSGGGGGIANDQSSPVFVNLTVSKNHATSSQSNQSGGIMNTNNSHATIYNSIIWGNTWGSPPNIGIGDVEFNANTFPNTLTYVNCLVGNTALGFNVPPPSYTTPGFVNPSIDNFRLLGGSVAIDIAADSILNALGITTDLDGLPRFFGSHADLGAYENQGVVITPDANGIVYVKKHVSTGDGTGQSWFNAAKELAKALDAAKSDSTIQYIWVAATNDAYYPLYNAADVPTSDNKDRAFVLVKDVRVYGGFRPDANDLQDTSIFCRQWMKDSTVLSGNIGHLDSLSDNVHHVVISAGDVGSACLDGFYITEGYAIGAGGNISVNSQTVLHEHGGGIINVSSSPALTNLVVFGNTAAAYGGGIMNYTLSPPMSPVLTNLIVGDNTANFGGGIYNYNSNSIMTNLLLIKNTAVPNGTGCGGGLFNLGSTPILTNTTISGNVADSGGGVFNFYSSPVVRNSIIWQNFNSAIGIQNISLKNVDRRDAGSVTTYLNTLLEGAPLGGGIILNGDPLFVDTALNDYRLSYCSPAIDTGHNQCYDAISTPDLSAVTIDLDSSVRIFNNIVDLGAYEFHQPNRVLPSLLSLYGDSLICTRDSAEITFVLQGTSPWKIIYTTDNSLTYDTIYPVLNDTMTWKVSPADTTTYKFTVLEDINCKAVLSQQDSIRINVIPDPVTNAVLTNDTLCHGGTVAQIIFGDTNLFSYEWEMSGDTISGIPLGTNTNIFGPYPIQNLDTLPKTTTITITPNYTSGSKICYGVDTSFKITVLPKPVVVHIPEADTLCNDMQTGPFVFGDTTLFLYEWEISEDTIDGIPLGKQTGNFGQYSVTNSDTMPLTTVIVVTTRSVLGTHTCTGTDTTRFSITVLPQPTLTNIFANDTLCHLEKTKPITFVGTGFAPEYQYEWTSSNTSIGLPSGVQMGSFGNHTVQNLTSAPELSTITVKPLYIFKSKVCTSTDSSTFSITVLPKPTLTNTLANDTLCHGTTTTPIPFTGTSNIYEWIWSGDSTISKQQVLHPTNTFGPDTVRNTTAAPRTTVITVTTAYVLDNKRCEGDTSEFSITVLPLPTLTNTLTNDTLCHGATTTPITFAGTHTDYKWINSGDNINSIPTGLQTGNFGAYTVNNSGNSPLTAEIKVLPRYLLGSEICEGDTSVFKITVLPNPTLANTLTNDTLCHGTETTPISFTGTANVYEWKWSGDSTINKQQVLQTGNFGPDTVRNTTSAPLTTVITVTTAYVLDNRRCEGDTSAFNLAVLPLPTLTNTLTNDTLCHGTKNTAIAFTGTANNYQWICSGDSIAKIPQGVQTGNFGSDTVWNTTSAPLTTRITVTPRYIYYDVSCSGTDTGFSITVNPLPVFSNIPSDYTLCNEDTTLAVNFAGVFTSYEWENTGDAITGLPTGLQTSGFPANQVINNTDTLQTAVITARAKYLNGKMCIGPDMDFKLSVSPVPTLTNIPSDTVLCSGIRTEEIVFSGVATSHVWHTTGDQIDSIPTGVQTGNFGEYILINRVSVPLTTKVVVTPQYIHQGTTCSGQDSGFLITVNPIPVLDNMASDYALCSGDKTAEIIFGSDSTISYEWETGGDTIDGIPVGRQNGNFGEYSVTNNADSPLTTTIKVILQYKTASPGTDCMVMDTSFRITVNPNPVITNLPSDYVICNGESTTELIFDGVFTNYEWETKGDAIPGLPIGLQTGNFGEYTLQNGTQSPLEAIIVIRGYYVANGLNCKGDDTSFRIGVNPIPSISNVFTDDTLCDGTKTSPIVFTGVATDYEWIVSGTVNGLPSGVQAGNFGEYTVTNKTSFETSSIISVTPKYITGNTVCTGDQESFRFVVYPHTSIDSINCNKPIMCEEEFLELKVSAIGGTLSYQWYRDNVLLSGETNNRYIELESKKSHSGNYYVDVTGYCGTVKSTTLWVDVRSDKMLVEKWHDVILVDNSTNEYFGYQWYKDGNMLPGSAAREQFYQEVGGLKGCYSVELTLVGGGKIRSCERCVDKVPTKSLSIYPNPVAQGVPVHVSMEEDDAEYTKTITVEVYTMDGKRVYRKQFNQGTFDVETNGLSSGMYILKLIAKDGQIYNEKIVVY